MSAEAVATLLVYRGNTNVLTAWGLRLTDLMVAGRRPAFCQRCQQVIIIPSRAVDLFLLPDRCFDDLRAAMRSTDSF